MAEPATLAHFWGGKARPGSSARFGEVYDPARGARTARVPLASADEVDVAVTTARAAAGAWASTSLAERSRLLFALREQIESHADELARCVTAEHGKVAADARGEVARGLENVEFACGIGELLKGSHSASASTGVDVTTVRRPLGVVAGITPFNFPVMVPLWMIPNAIACGNTFVLKPSEKDPSASLLLAELFSRAGFPEGVLSVVHGDRVAVERLLSHPDIAAISFVGSTPVARRIYEEGTRAGKRVQALGGAKNHMVVLPDADVGMAADAAVSAAYGSAGERCMAISVVVAVGEVADPLVEGIAARARALRVGPGDRSTSEMGPLITGEHRDRVAGYLDTGCAEGATLVVDGRVGALPDEGFFLGASLFDRVEPGMEIYRDEIFGPVLCVVRVSDYDEALAVLHDNPWGNGTAIFTRDGGAARRFQEDVAVGMVGINVPIPVPVGFHSFGGWGDSLFGDTHMYGPEGIRFYTRAQVVTTRWPDPAQSQVDLGFPRSR